MKIAVIGASGFTGRPVVDLALSEGHTVYAVSRKGVFTEHKNLVIIHEDVNNVSSLLEKLKDVDVIISNYNAGWDNPNLYNDFIKGSESTIELAKKLGKRIIIVGGASSLYDPSTQVQVYFTADEEFKKMVKGAFDLYNRLLPDHSFDWTFVSPPFELNEEKPNHNYNIGGDYVLFNSDNKSTVSIHDLAHLLLTEATHGVNNHKRITLADK
ncbi:NAD(P)-dependent oxidoreductase [Haploplasma axanthum]|uniref:NADH-flavin reductase n=1 Tax=Haploplasma axanthum TaxID=29552 RepID=A0A449BDU7_HAPAX|nr:NAD(P)H-binding protein [Haploplasma axanthum]VEU80597.1 Putative NADH-flavin reductase [Haploplasma axanthum]